MVVENQTDISSWVLKRVTSAVDFSTAKMGNKSSRQMLSQNSGEKLDPCSFKVAKRESRALKQFHHPVKATSFTNLHLTNFKILPIHYYVVEAE
jgi:hypothetical protein